jgi:hypothetical protein
MQTKIFVLIGIIAAHNVFAGNVTSRSVGGYVQWGYLSIPAWNTSYDACAPEVKHGNLAATDRALMELASASLKAQTQFVNIVQDAQKLDEAQRLHAYLALADITKDDDIANFVGAREINPHTVEALVKNTGLNSEQAHLLAEKISQSLLGERK